MKYNYFNTLLLAVFLSCSVTSLAIAANYKSGQSFDLFFPVAAGELGPRQTANQTQIAIQVCESANGRQFVYFPYGNGDRLKARVKRTNLPSGKKGLSFRIPARDGTIGVYFEPDKSPEVYFKAKNVSNFTRRSVTSFKRTRQRSGWKITC